MTHAYCASGVVRFSSKRSPVYRALSERAALRERPVRTRGHGLSWASNCGAIHRVKARSGENGEGRRKRKNFSLAACGMSSLVQGACGRGRCGNGFPSAPEHLQGNSSWKRLP